MSFRWECHDQRNLGYSRTRRLVRVMVEPRFLSRRGSFGMTFLLLYLSFPKIPSPRANPL